MEKEYSLIAIEDGFVVVDKEAKYQTGKYWTYMKAGGNFFGLLKEGSKQIPCMYELHEVNGGIHFIYKADVLEGMIIAHTGIPSLKDSGLPLIEIPDIAQQIADKRFFGTAKKEIGMMKAAFVLGYKAAGGYTEDDVRDAIIFGYKECLKNDNGRGETGIFEKDIVPFIQSLKKKQPVAVVLEIEEKCCGLLDNSNKGKSLIDKCNLCSARSGVIEPKIIDNHVVIKEVKYV